MNLDTTINLDLKAFFQWWGRELAFLVPLRLRELLRDRKGTLLVMNEAEGFTFKFKPDSAQQSEVEAFLSWQALDSYRALEQKYPIFEKAERLLQLRPEQGLQKTLYLPAAAQENLQQVVRFELDRYTPFKPEQLYFSAEVIDKVESGQVRVCLVLTPKSVLDPLLQGLESMGFRPQQVVYPHAVVDSKHNLLPERYRDSGARLGQFLHWSLNLIILGLMLGVMIWPVWLEGEAIDRVKQAIKALDKDTQRVEAQQHEIDALHAETQKLIDVKRKTPALTAILDELTRALNDETWLTHFQYADQHLQIQGQSPAASALIGILEASDFFNNVSFVSPLTQDKTTGRERFQISMDVVMPEDFGANAEQTPVDDATEAGDAGSEPAPDSDEASQDSEGETSE